MLRSSRELRALHERRAGRGAGGGSGRRGTDGAVAVVDEALIARGQCQVAATGDPTAHAVMVVIRETARRLGRSDLRGVVVFATVEPCAMCVGALLEADVDRLVYAMPDAAAGAAGSAVQLTDGDLLPRRLEVVSGIMAREATDLRDRAILGAARV